LIAGREDEEQGTKNKEKLMQAVAAWRWLASLAVGWRKRPVRQLRLCETLGLGERRFLAVVQFGGLKFLIGGTGSSVALLAKLPANAAQLEEPAAETCLARDDVGLAERLESSE
jgi:flagellar biogenesis protein FliO